MLGTACFTHHHDRGVARCPYGFQSERPAVDEGDGIGGGARSQTLARDAERRRRFWVLAAWQRIVALPEHSRRSCAGACETETVRRAAGNARQGAEVSARDRI